MYRPSELLKFLQEHALRPKKRLSQNFLIDGNIIAKIVTTADIQPGCSVLEIGPGPGALTQALLAAGARVIAVEKDAQLAAALERLQTPDGRLKVITSDIMHVALDELPKETTVVANLPYHLTTPILTALVPQAGHLKRIVVMVQREVARRMCAVHGSKTYGSLSVFLQLQSDVSYAFEVKRTCFYPVPKVNSAVVRLDLHPPPLDDPELFTFTRLAFCTRRKMLRRTLRERYGVDTVTAALKACGLSETARPEQIAPYDFVKLYTTLTAQSEGEAHHQTD